MNSLLNECRVCSAIYNDALKTLEETNFCTSVRDRAGRFWHNSRTLFITTNVIFNRYTYLSRHPSFLYFFLLSQININRPRSHERKTVPPNKNRTCIDFFYQGNHSYSWSGPLLVTNLATGDFHDKVNLNYPHKESTSFYDLFESISATFIFVPEK